MEKQIIFNYDEKRKVFTSANCILTDEEITMLMSFLADISAHKVRMKSLFNAFIDCYQIKTEKDIDNVLGELIVLMDNDKEEAKLFSKGSSCRLTTFLGYVLEKFDVIKRGISNKVIMKWLNEFIKSRTLVNDVYVYKLNDELTDTFNQMIVCEVNGFDDEISNNVV